MNQAAIIQSMPALNQGLLQALFGGQMPQGGDAFAAIFAQLMEGMEGEALPTFGETAQLFAAQDDTKTDEDANLLAMEMLSGLFLNGQFPLDDLMVGAAVPQQVVEALPAVFPRENIPVSFAEKNVGFMAEPVQRQEKLSEIIPVSFPSQKENAQNGEQPDAGFRLMQGQAEFRNAVSEAKKRLGSQSKETGEVNVEALQAEVSSGKFQNVSQTSFQRPLSELDAKDLTDQVKTGIRRNLANGKNEFVVKLRPSGMGEITVKLVEKESRMTLSIVASNSQVAKLLSSEAASLQSALRPLQVEVKEIAASSQPAGAENNPAQMSFAGQSFAEQQRQFLGQNHNGAASSGFEQDGFEELLGETETRVETDSGLDAYI